MFSGLWRNGYRIRLLTCKFWVRVPVDPPLHIVSGEMRSQQLVRNWRDFGLGLLMQSDASGQELVDAPLLRHPVRIILNTILIICSLRLEVRISDFHSVDTGSNPVGNANSSVA